MPIANHQRTVGIEDVECPRYTCRSRGPYCVTPSGKIARSFHTERVIRSQAVQRRIDQPGRE